MNTETQRLRVSSQHDLTDYLFDIMENNQFIGAVEYKENVYSAYKKDDENLYLNKLASIQRRQNVR